MKDPVNLIIFPSKRKKKIQRDFIFKSMTKNRQQCKLFVYNWAKAKLLFYRYHITLHIICSICHYTTWRHWVRHMTYAHGLHTHPSSSCYATQAKSLGMQVPVPVLYSRVTDLQSGPPGRSAARAKVGSSSFSDSIEGLSVKWEQ